MTTLLELSKATVPLIVAIVLIRAICMNHLPKRTFVALWTVALLRLLIPLQIPSQLSIHTLWAKLSAIEIVSAPTVMAAPAQTLSQEAAAIPISLPEVVHVSEAAALPVASSPAIAWYAWVWLAVALLALGYFVTLYLHSHRRFAASLPLENTYVDVWLATHPLRRAVRVRQSDQITSPLTYGILRPVILLPKAALRLPPERLSAILAHEHTHIRRFDAITKLLLAFTLCLHWFNPLVWVLYVLFNRDIELACDEAVIRSMGETVKSSYALMLLGMEEKRGPSSPLYSSFSKYAIEERINAIMKMKRKSIWSSLIALSLILVMPLVFATTGLAATATTDKQDSAPQTTTIDTGEGVFEVEWYTYDEFKAWLDGEREALKALAEEGAVGWSAGRGTFTWTQEIIDETLAQYEDMLEAIEDGALVSKPMDGAGPGDSIVFMEGASNSMAGVSVARAEATERKSTSTSRALPGTKSMSVASTRAGSAGEATTSYSIQFSDEAIPAESLAAATAYAVASDVVLASPAELTVTEKEVSVGSNGATISISALSDGVFSVTEAGTTRSGTATISEDLPNAIQITRATESSPYIVTITSMDELTMTTDGESGTANSYSAHVALGEKLTANIGPYDSEESLLDAVERYVSSLVEAKIVTQAEADEILNNF